MNPNWSWYIIIIVVIVVVAKSCPTLFAIACTLGCQVSLSMGFPKQEYLSGLSYPSPGDLPHPRIKCTSPALAGGFFTTEPPDGSVVEPSTEPACQGRRYRFDPWMRKIPGRRNGSPPQYSCLENSMDRGAWWAAIRGVPKSQTQLSD